MMQEMWTILRILNWTKAYFEDKGIRKRSCEIERIASGCVGIHRTTGQHPGGIIVLPLGEEINSFTPVRHAPGKAGTRGLYPRRERVSRLYLCRDC